MRSKDQIVSKYIATSWGRLQPYKELAKSYLSERFLKATGTYTALQLAEQSLARLRVSAAVTRRDIDDSNGPAVISYARAAQGSFLSSLL